MARSGTRSVYGDFKIKYTPDGSSTGIIVAQAKGVAVYTPNSTRRFELGLDNPPGTGFDKGSFNIVFSERDETTKTPVTSQIDLAIP